MPRWSAQNEAALLMAIIEAAGIKVSSKDIMERVADIMGDRYTIRGVIQHWTLMKKRRDDGGLHNTVVQGGAAPDTKLVTPHKRKSTFETGTQTKKAKVDSMEHDKNCDEVSGKEEKPAFKHEDEDSVVKTETIEQDESPI